jgi:hypothetical protein
LRKVLADVGGHGRTRAVEIQAPGQLVGQQREVKGLAVRQKLAQESVSGGGPVGAVIATGGGHSERVLVHEPLVTQLIKPGAADHQALGGGGGVELARVEGGEDVLDVEGGNAVSELFLFIGAGR